MAIISTDLHLRLSGGGANADPNASLGGAKSSVELVYGTPLHILFDQVSSAESAAGDDEYRCIYIHNAHATLTAQNTVVLINTDTVNAESDIRIALGTSAIDGTEQTIADEDTAPIGVTWETTAGVELAIGDLTPGQHKAIWIHRNISVDASAINNDSFTLEVKCDTAA